MPSTRSVGRAAIGAAWLILISSAGLSPVFAQDGEVVLRADTRVVEVDVSVRDAAGKAVGDLTKSDFTILDNRKPRAFTIFSVNRAGDGSSQNDVAAGLAPRLPPNTFTNLGAATHPAEGHSTVILLDAINGWFDNFAGAANQVKGMVGNIPADEKVAIYVIAKVRGLVMLQDYTTDRARLVEAIGSYIPEGMCAAPPGMERGDEGMHEARSLGMAPRVGPSSCQDPYSLQVGYDAVQFAMKSLAKQLASQPGRKSVFWITQGFPPAPLREQPAWNATMDALNEANIAVNTVDSNGVGGPARLWGPGGTLAMIELAERTGGTAYYHRNDLGTAIMEGIEDVRSSYTLGFYLTETDGNFHELKVSVNRPGLQLGYRHGYYAVDEPKRDKKREKSDLSAVLLRRTDSAEVGITASLDVKPGTPRGTLNVRLKLNPESLSLKSGNGVKTGKVKQMFLEMNAAGKVVGKISCTSEFTVRPEKQADFDAHGITIPQSFLLPVGTEKLAIVVQDAESGRTGSLTVPLRSVVTGR